MERPGRFVAQIPFANLHMPNHHKDADVIEGPLSADQPGAWKRKRFANQGEWNQIACVSYDI
jgi:hypothetical protein